jgi:hypothetical protein
MECWWHSGRGLDSDWRLLSSLHRVPWVHQTNPNREQFPSQRALVPLATLTLSDRFLRLILANFQCVTKYSRQTGYRDLRNTIQTRYGLRVSLVPTLAKQHDGQPVPPATRAKATLNPFQVSNIGLIGYHVVGFLVWRPPSHPSSLHSPHASTGTRHAWFRALGRIKQPPPSRNNPDQINPRPLAQKGSEEWPSSAMRTAKTTSKSHDTREYVLLDPMHASPWSEPNTQGRSSWRCAADRKYQQSSHVGSSEDTNHLTPRACLDVGLGRRRRVWAGFATLPC